MDQSRRDVHDAVRDEFAELAGWVDEMCPDGREKSLAITALEEAMFWANAAIARPRVPVGMTLQPSRDAGQVAAQKGPHPMPTNEARGARP